MATKRFIFQGCSERFDRNDAKILEVPGSERSKTLPRLGRTKTGKLGIVTRV